ncbi:hypothetical protein NDU88_006055 [Pleurodeles waltl]|uniref:Uncharacterized protein n=1 Tax=Pleurodeles waltl TaxID=8319 RepID=A0AAV7L2P7_PLEWA|nr:hypothetical protein NDU88_006055 [Pleurodeles waltl]
MAQVLKTSSHRGDEGDEELSADGGRDVRSDGGDVDLRGDAIAVIRGDDYGDEVRSDDDVIGGDGEAMMLGVMFELMMMLLVVAGEVMIKLCGNDIKSDDDVIGEEVDIRGHDDNYVRADDDARSDDFIDGGDKVSIRDVDARRGDDVKDMDGCDDSSGDGLKVTLKVMSDEDDIRHHDDDAIVDDVKEADGCDDIRFDDDVIVDEVDIRPHDDDDDDAIVVDVKDVDGCDGIRGEKSDGGEGDVISAKGGDDNDDCLTQPFLQGHA